MEPYNSFVLRCSAAIPSAVIPDIDIVWFFNEVQLANVDDIIHISIDDGNGNGSKWKTSSLEIENGTTSISGNYTCNIIVSLEASTDIERAISIPVHIRGIPVWIQ